MAQSSWPMPMPRDLAALHDRCDASILIGCRLDKESGPGALGLEAYLLIQLPVQFLPFFTL